MSDQWRKICDNYKEHNELLMEQLKEKNARILDLNNRVEELEEEKYQDPRQGMLEDLHAENQCYKQALEHIATRKMSTYLSVSDMNKDFIKVANEALKGDTNDRRASV